MGNDAPVIFGQYPELFKITMSRVLYDRILRLAEKNGKSFYEQFTELLREAEIIEKD